MRHPALCIGVATADFAGRRETAQRPAGQLQSIDPASRSGRESAGGSPVSALVQGATLMMNLPCSAAAAAASAVTQAARLLLSDLEQGRRIDAAGILRSAMETAFDTSDRTAAWHWKTAYDACEAATALFFRKLRAGHPRQGRLVRRHVADACENRDPHALLGRMAGASAVPDPASAWLDCVPSAYHVSFGAVGSVVRACHHIGLPRSHWRGPLSCKPRFSESNQVVILRHLRGIARGAQIVRLRLTSILPGIALSEST